MENREVVSEVGRGQPQVTSALSVVNWVTGQMNAEIVVMQTEMTIDLDEEVTQETGADHHQEEETAEVIQEKQTGGKEDAFFVD